MAMITESQAAEARAAALRQDPRVMVRQRTTDAPYQPMIEATEQADILELLERRDQAAEASERPA